MPSVYSVSKRIETGTHEQSGESVIDRVLTAIAENGGVYPQQVEDAPIEIVERIVDHVPSLVVEPDESIVGTEGGGRDREPSVDGPGTGGSPKFRRVGRLRTGCYTP